jgi:uncharacterized protein (TIGR03086 family)
MDLIERWRHTADAFTAHLEAVAADQWDSPTPCPDWNVRELVEHAISAQARLPKELGTEIEIPESDDPKATWRVVRDAARGAYEKPGALDVEFDLPFGKLTGAQLVNNLATGDLLIHTWDLARATGTDERLDPDVVAAVYQGLEPLDEIMRAGAFGPRVEPPEGADLQTELLCFSGRRP